jgi:hypothetical protein
MVAAENDARLLGGLRVLVFTLWLYTALSASLAPLAQLPLELLEPVWLLQAIPRAAWERILQPTVLTVFQALMVFASLAAAIGVRPYRATALLAAALATFDQALKRSWGYGDHPEILLLLTTYVIALAPAGDRLSWPRGRDLSPYPGEYAAPIAFIGVIACFTYVAPAAYRVAHHSWATLTSPTLLYAIVQNSFRGPSDSVGVFFLQHATLAQAMQLAVPLATLLELAAPLALLSRSFRRPWLLFALVFHSLNAFIVAVPFWENLIIVVATLVALDRLSEAASR